MSDAPRQARASGTEQSGSQPQMPTVRNGACGGRSGAADLGDKQDGEAVAGRAGAES